MITASGIYQIRNTINNHIYIGSAKDLSERKTNHFFLLNHQRHHSTHLQNAYNLYGKDNFVFETLITCDPSMLIWYEQQFIDQWKPEYNILPTAGSCLGSKQTEETIKKKMISMLGKNKGKFLTKEQKKHLSEINKGKVQTKETIEKRILAITGQKRSDLARKRMSDAQKGKHMPKESTVKMRERLKKPLVHQLISPDGIIYTVVDRKEFCKEHGLNISCVCQLDKGKQFKHKGWKIFERSKNG